MEEAIVTANSSSIREKGHSPLQKSGSKAFPFFIENLLKESSRRPTPPANDGAVDILLASSKTSNPVHVCPALSYLPLRKRPYPNSGPLRSLSLPLPLPLQTTVTDYSSSLADARKSAAAALAINSRQLDSRDWESAEVSPIKPNSARTEDIPPTEEELSDVKRKKTRTSFSNAQIKQLEQKYATHRYLPTTQRRQLAKALMLTDQQVKTWFQNRRMKEKRQFKDEHHFYRALTPYPLPNMLAPCRHQMAVPLTLPTPMPLMEMPYPLCSTVAAPGTKPKPYGPHSMQPILPPTYVPLTPNITPAGNGLNLFSKHAVYPS